MISEIRCAFSWRALLAVEAVEGGEVLLDPGIGDPVPDRLAFAAEGDDTLVPYLGEMLRQSRLRQADDLGQGRDVGFAPFHQLAQDHQVALVGERPQDVRDLRRPLLKSSEVEFQTGDRHKVS